MAAGRCEGCGRSDSASKIARHIQACDEWLKLYARDPALALSPEESARRWKGGGRASERAAYLLAVTSDIEERRAAALERFRPADILAD
jgi:hypothetical protein